MYRPLKCLLSFLAFLLAFNAFSQSSYKLSGKVLADDFSPLYNASVYISGFSIGTSTDSLGQFQLGLSAGINEVSFSYLGYRSVALKLFLSHDTIIEVQMKTDFQLGEVIIADSKKLKAAEHDATGVITLRKENFISLPALMGENDPIRAVQMQPGIQSGNEGSRGIFVRGGSPDQNQILIDGAPVYNPSHLYGFLSVFNADAIDKIDVYKDNYPAQFGGRLGSVMDIGADAGNNNHIKGSFSLGILTSRIHIEGPLDKNHSTTFSLSLRACYAGLFTSPISKIQYKKAGYNGDVAYYFGDVNAKLAHHFGANDEVDFTYFSNNDLYSFTKKSDTYQPGTQVSSEYIEKVNWANYVASFGWNHRFNDKWKTHNSVSYSQYIINSQLSNHYQENSSYYYQSLYDSKTTSYIRDVSYKNDTKFETGKMQTIRLGAGVTGLIFETGKGAETTINSYYGNSAASFKSGLINSISAFVYAGDEVKPSDKWLINGGVYGKSYTVQGKTFLSLLPRLNVVYSPVKNFSLRTSASGLSQDLHLLTTSTVNSNILNDYWVPATAVAKPETGWNFSGGMIQKLPLNFEWSVDGFYRLMNNLIDYKEGANYSSLNLPWYDQIVTGGKGRAYGLETYVARNYGRVTGSIAYTLAWSERQFTDLNSGNYFPYKYDRRHNIATQLNFIINKHFEIGASWVYGSGNRMTLPLQSYNTWVAAYYHDYNVQNGSKQPENGEQVTVYTGKNEYRLPAYHHLDISMTYKKKVKKLEHQFNLSIYNVYNHYNIFEVYSDYRIAADGSRVIVYKQLSLFPILPSISYGIKFGA
ncbi:MAG: outer rane receptor for ferrienterochelin and colicin [Bacteroidota bacterium]|nr:outer rane receptor for ferrienterochelin and colicin [Bacteroidota bacterium]